MTQRGFVLPSMVSMLGVLCVALLATAFILHQLWRGAQNDFAEFRAAVALAQEQAKADAARRHAEQERISRETAEGWAAAVEWYRTHPRIVRVRESSAACSDEMPTISSTPATVDEPPVDSGFDTITLTSAECERRLDEAILDAARLMWLQAWVKAQVDASKEEIDAE